MINDRGGNMNQISHQRRKFLRDSMVVIGAAAAGAPAHAAVALNVRPEWSEFKLSSHLGPLISAISRMKANTNASDPSSWLYWVNAHVNYCPHNIAYFMAWHRGFLYHFEKRLRIVSGDSQLVLPYWDYFTNPVLPAEFTNASSTNPLYVPRVNSNVRQALDLGAFAPAVTNFPRGATNAFEALLEDAPHNPVHDIIGGDMTTMQSPIDPIFWLHHANIDRLWAAWIAAGGGRTMPARSDPYWTGSFTYASGLSISRQLTYSNRSSLNYYYRNESLPTSLPAIARLTDNAQPDGPASASAVRNDALTDARSIDPSTFSVVGALKIALGEQSAGFALPVPAEHRTTIARIARGLPSATMGRSEQFRSLWFTLNGVETTRAGRNGGYFYNVWITLSSTSETMPGPRIKVRAGTLGAFQIAGASHHGPGRIAYPVTDLLSRFTPGDLAMLLVSFERVNGDNSPAGPVITIGEARLEMSTDGAI